MKQYKHFFYFCCVEFRVRSLSFPLPSLTSSPNLNLRYLKLIEHVTSAVCFNGIKTPSRELSLDSPIPLSPPNRAAHACCHALLRPVSTAIVVGLQNSSLRLFARFFSRSMTDSCLVTLFISCYFHTPSPCFCPFSPLPNFPLLTTIKHCEDEQKKLLLLMFVIT